MNKVYTEKDLVLPALVTIYEKSQDYGIGVDTTELMDTLREKLNPQGDDLTILSGRNDDKFSQKVRNLVSHKTLEKYTDFSDSGRFTIKEEGVDYLIEKNVIDDEYSANIVSDDFRDQNDGYFGNKKASVENIYCSVSDLKRKFDRALKGDKDEVLHLDASFQRGGNIWNKKNKSLLVESVLLNIPIPSIYLSEDSRGNLIVIDGRQRLSTLFDYMDDKFKLSGLTLMDKLNGKKFSQLIGDEEKYKAMIEDKSLHIAKIRFGSDETFIIETFERVNTKGARLNAQEIRNALHNGKSTELLNSISEDFDKNEKIIDKKRMKDKYLVLRYFAMDKYYQDLQSNRNVKFTSITDYLASIMEEINLYDNMQINNLKNEFITLFNKAINIFGEQTAFRLEDKSPLKKKLPINMILFEISLLLTKYQQSKTDAAIRKSLEDFINSNKKNNSDEETPFEKNIRYHRDSNLNIAERINWVKKIVEE